MGFEPPDRARKQLTPFASELRASVPPPPRRNGPWSRFRAWRRARRQAPQTFGRFVAAGLARLTVALAAGAGVALLVARLLDRTLAIGLYIAGAAVLGLTVFMTAADDSTPFYIGQQEREHRVRTSLSYALVGLILIAFGVVLEAR